ncbi:ATP-binding protein [Spirosoma aerolatum]|uniref:ATP-binding protein n=1 Tax=Spirosoma aerolatum TaxID=1211326 RepID=UPI0009ABB443|nr:ATP-binding protein [Spirosoma aerolatum]
MSITYRNGYTELIVNDNGTGIPQTIREKIFRPFFTTKPTGEGTRIGLSHAIITKGYEGSRWR